MRTKRQHQTPHPDAGEPPLHDGNELVAKGCNLRSVLPIRERYAVTVPIAAQFIGISRTRVYELLAGGELEGKIIHGRRIVLVSSLLRMLGEAPSAKRSLA